MIQRIYDKIKEENSEYFLNNKQINTENNINRRNNSFIKIIKPIKTKNNSKSKTKSQSLTKCKEKDNKSFKKYNK